MGISREFVGTTVLFFSALCLVIFPQAPSTSAQSAEPTPAFHSELPPGPLPQTLDPSQFSDAIVKNTYTLAAKVKKVLYQQPCYCHCDRSQGHGSLLDCYVSKHASVCDVCIREGLFAYEQTRKGKTPAQIRAAIERGDWQKVDVYQYISLPARP